MGKGLRIRLEAEAAHSPGIHRLDIPTPGSLRPAISRLGAPRPRFNQTRDTTSSGYTDLGHL